MKLLLFFAMTGLAFAQDEAAPGSSGKGTSPSTQIDPTDVPSMVQQLLQTYKQVLLEAKPILDAADVQLPKGLLDESGVTAGRSSNIQGKSEASHDTLDLGSLKTGSLQTGGLPLTLPNVDPTTEPIQQYQMWRKAARDKATRDRYLELRRLARAD